MKLPEQNILTRDNVKTMSEVIRDETVVVRVGCLAGPNLAKELGEGQPGATVVASHFDEVIRIGQQLLRNPRFQVYGNSDLIGIELCGVLKNIIAIASGVLYGLGLGENVRALLVSRLVNRGRRLGESTLDPRNPDQAQVAASFAALMQPADQRLTLVDVTPVNRTRNFHNFGLETPEFFDDLFLRLTETGLPRGRRLH